MVQLAEELMTIQARMDQVLRVKTQLESRVNQYMALLGNNVNSEKFVSILTSLENTFRRKERVMKLVIEFLENIQKIIMEAEEIVLKTQGFWKRLGSNLVSQIPLVNKKFGRNRQPLIPLLNILYSHIQRQFKHFKKIIW